jgi:hypothetical protein
MCSVRKHVSPGPLLFSCRVSFKVPCMSSCLDYQLEPVNRDAEWCISSVLESWFFLMSYGGPNENTSMLGIYLTIICSCPDLTVYPSMCFLLRTQIYQIG